MKKWQFMIHLEMSIGSFFSMDRLYFVRECARECIHPVVYGTHNMPYIIKVKFIRDMFIIFRWNFERKRNILLLMAVFVAAFVLHLQYEQRETKTLI